MFERFSEQARRVVDLAMGEAERAGHRYLGPEHLVLGVLADAGDPAVRVGVSRRRHRRIVAHVGLPDGYEGAAGPLLAALGVDAGELRDAVAAELGGARS